jgi:plasmid stabilization system protein ParE
MKVHWTENAIEHLVNIYEYIALNSPTYAKRTVDRITRRSTQISDYPLSGRKVPEYETDGYPGGDRKIISSHLPDKAGSN